jgi:predicted esterase
VAESADLPFFIDMLDWLRKAPIPIDPKAIFCIGFSSGAFMSSRLARALPQHFTAVALHSGGDANSISLSWRGPELNCSSPLIFSSDHPPTLVIHGGRDGFVPVACGIHYYAELRRQGISTQLLLNPEGGHIWQSQFNTAILAWFSQFVGLSPHSKRIGPL